MLLNEVVKTFYIDICFTGILFSIMNFIRFKFCYFTIFPPEFLYKN